MPEITRKLEDQQIFLNHWFTGLITNRSPLFTPMSPYGIQIVQRQDALWSGLNMELSPQATLVRRAGYSKFNTGQFDIYDKPLTFFSFKNLLNTIYPMVDSADAVLYIENPGTLFDVFSKANGAGQSSFLNIGNWLYWADGTSVPQKWNGGTGSQWGINAPTIGPGVSTSAGSLSPTTGYSWVYCYYNSNTGHYSTASTSISIGAQTSKEFVISLTASADAQVTNIALFRTADGGSLYYLVSNSIANSTANYTDNHADSALNTLLIAPLADANDPPPGTAGSQVSGCLQHLSFYAGFAFGSVGNALYYSSGPNCTIGVSTECWPPANNFLLPGNITCMKATSVGLAIFTTDDLYLLTGTNISSFTLLPWQSNFGVLSENCVCQDGDTLYVYTSRGLLYQVQYGQGVTEIGYNIRPILGAMSPSAVYITLHRSGADEGLFISDGSTNIYRYGLDFGAWSPVAQPAQGAGAIGSIETSTGVWTLLMGSPTLGQYVWYRNPGTYTDNGTAYVCNVVVGSLVVSPPGTVSQVDRLIVQNTSSSVGTWTVPSVGVLINNVSGTFSALSGPVGDPPLLAGTPYEPTNPVGKIWYLKSVSSALPQLVQNLQVQISFPNDTTASEIIGLTIG